jgi:hypothetical protein
VPPPIQAFLDAHPVKKRGSDKTWSKLGSLCCALPYAMSSDLRKLKPKPKWYAGNNPGRVREAPATFRIAPSPPLFSGISFKVCQKEAKQCNALPSVFGT